MTTTPVAPMTDEELTILDSELDEWRRGVGYCRIYFVNSQVEALRQRLRLAESQRDQAKDNAIVRLQELGTELVTANSHIEHLKGELNVALMELKKLDHSLAVAKKTISDLRWSVSYEQDKPAFGDDGGSYK